jgi:hypothetical protein
MSSAFFFFGMITRNKAELARQRQQAALERAVRNRTPLGSTPAPARSPKPPKAPNPVHKPKP